MRMDGSWSAVRRFSFQLVFCYWALYTTPLGGDSSVLGSLPWIGEKITGWIFTPMQHLAVWLGTHLFHLSGVAASFHPTGSGDTALSWIVVLCDIALAFVAATAWHLIDRKHPQYRTLAAWMRWWLAVTLGLTMLAYGFYKVFPLQFGSPGVIALNETYGESTPMRLLWTFMGASRGYTFFAGLGEVTGAMLLLFRRTRTAGALLSGAILFNIVLLNLFYDVPVKLYSFHLLLMALTLLAPDLRAMAGLLFLRKQVQLSTDGVPAPERRGLRIASRCVQACVILGGLWMFGVKTFLAVDPPAVRPALYGSWRVDTISADATIKPWQQVFFSDPGTLLIRDSAGELSQVRFVDRAGDHTYEVKSGPWGTGELHYVLQGQPRVTAMVLEGRMNKGSVHAELTRTSPDKFLLETQGFHWTHEFPPNR